MRSLLAAALIALSLAVPGTALAAVKAGQPFPSNLFAIADRTQVTGLRVDLPKPDCAARPSDCADVDVLNTLDGFNIQPRISIPFSAPIDVATVSSETVFLIGPRGRRVGINQVVWEPAANTLHVESDEQLEQHSRYLLIVTRGIRGTDGQRLDGSAFWRDLLGHAPAATKSYRTQLLLALGASIFAGADPGQVAGASLFTTQSIDAISK
jgi:hypothetical protein